MKLIELIINSFEKDESKLDGIIQIEACDFKLLFFESLTHLLIKAKDKKEIWKKLFLLINKYLKKDIKEIGLKIRSFLKNLITVQKEKIGEINVRAFIELLTYVNENSHRIQEIWNLSINGNKIEKKLARNSFDLLGYFNYDLFISYNSFSYYLSKQDVQSFSYLIELKTQLNNIIENNEKIVNSIKAFKDIDISTNIQSNVFEKYLFFITPSFYLFYYVVKNKNRNITKEQAELICFNFHFILKNTTIPLTYQRDIKYFEEIIKDSQIFFKNQINPFNEYIINNWKTYFNPDVYLQNNYKSDNKYNIIILNLIKYYSNCFLEEVNKEKLIIHKELIKCFIDDKFKMFKNLISKINDFKLSFETKLQIVNLIIAFYDWSLKQKNFIDFDTFYFFLRQITLFYQTLYSLSSEIIYSHIREENKQQKELLHKNLLKLDFEENTNYIKKNNLNHLFLDLLKSDYDKYFFFEEQKSLTEFLKSTRILLKKLIDSLKQIINPNYMNCDSEKKSIIIDRSALQFGKIFFFFFYIFEKYKVNHQSHDTPTDLIDELLEMYICSFPGNLGLFISIFKRLISFIYKLYKLGVKICPNKNCILTKLIHNIFKSIRDVKLRQTLFSIYFEYFSMKIFEIGNPNEFFNLNQSNIISYSLVINESINNITILKSIFYNLFDCVTDFQYFKNNIFPLIIDTIYLSKNSEYYGNYIYILRSIFKYLRESMNRFLQNSNGRQEETAERKEKLEINNLFSLEIFYILYGIIKYLINIKEQKPFLSEIILEMILTMPVRFKYLSDIPHLTFPPLIDSLNNSTENAQLNLGNLDNWMNLYIRFPEMVVPYIQKYLSEIIDLLSNNLHRPTNTSIYLASLKWVSKLSRKSRNYMAKKKIIPRECPTQILSMKLKEINSERTMNFILDNIIDIDINNSLILGNKTLFKKIPSLNDKKIISIIEIYKICLSAFFSKKIDYDYIIEIKKNIIKGINFTEEEFNSDKSFKVMNDKNSRIKINTIYRKKEQILINRIITGLLVINSSFIQITNNQKDKISYGNNIMKFISDYFLLILLSKEKNNKNMLIFEIDPIIIIDEILQFFFINNFSIIRNTNAQLAEYSINIIKNLVDSINKFFDNDSKIIRNLEIVEIIYMKFINCCYVNEYQKIDSGLILLKILLQNFDKSVNYKYLKYFFKCITNIASNYSNLIKIQLKSRSNILVENIDILIKIFVINDENYYKLNKEYLIDDKNIEKIYSDKEKEIILNAKNNFIMLFDFIKYCFDSIVDRIDSSNNYTRSLGIYIFKKIIGNIPQLRRIIPILFQIDISKISLIQFYEFYKESNISFDFERILFNCNNYNNINHINHINEDPPKNKYILSNYNSSKIYKKLEIIFNALTKKLGIEENKFSNLISYSDSLNNIFYYCPILIEEFIKKNIDLCIEVIKSLYINILTNYFSYCKVSQYFKEKQAYKSKFIYLYMEKILENENLKFNFKIKNKEGNEVIIDNEVKEEYIEEIEKYIFSKEIFRNEVNSRDFLISQLFEILDSKITLVNNYIKLLNNLFNKINYNKIEEKKLQEYKTKATKLMFLQILNFTTSSILKESSSFLCNIFEKNPSLKDNIFMENYDKINKYICEINKEKIINSNCYINQDIISGLDKNHINSLLIICKCMKLNHLMNDELIKKLKLFESFPEDKIGNSQMILFFGYISLFLYIDVKEEDLKIVFRLLLNRIKEFLKYSDKNLLVFTQTRYKKKIIKLITKYRRAFSQFLLDMTEYKYEHKFIFKLIKIIFSGENSVLISEQCSLDISNKIKNKIIIKENNKNEEEIKNSEVELLYYLKLSKQLFWKAPIYLKKTSFIESIDDYIKQIIINYDKNFEKIQDTNHYEKMIKYWIDIHRIYIEHYKYKYKYLLSLFFFISKKNVFVNEKNKIFSFIAYRIILVSNETIFETNFKYIMNEFIKFDTETVKYFDILVDYLIIPMMIRYLKIYNFFECFSVSVNKDNSFKIDIDQNQANKDKDNKIQFDEEFILNILEILTYKFHNTIFDTEKKEEVKYKLLSILIVVYLEYINKKENNINYNDKTTKIYYTIQSILSNSSFAEEEQDNGIWRIYFLLGIILFSQQEINEQNIRTTFIFYKNLNDDNNYIAYLADEIILSNSHSQNLLDKYCLQYYNDPSLAGKINILKVIIKYPSFANNFNDSTIKIILNIVYEISLKSSKNINYKRLLVQSIGFLISYISKQREIANNSGDTTELKIKNLPEIENFVYNLAFRIYKTYLLNSNDNNANENTENFQVLQKLIIYIRELLNSKTNFQMVCPKIEDNSIELKKNIHLYIQLFRMYMFNIKIDIIYQNFKLYFQIYDFMYKNNYNFRYFNDFAFIFRCITDEKLLKKLNNKEKPVEKTFIEYKLIILEIIESKMKDKTTMNQKFTDYDIKDLFIENNKNSEYEKYDAIYKNVYNYLVLNRLYIDRNLQINNSNGQNLQNDTLLNQQILTTNNSTSIIENRNLNERQLNIVDEWLKTFHINDFKYFILKRKFIDEFYFEMHQTLKDINEDKNNYINNSNNAYLKGKIVTKINNEKENLDLAQSITFSFFKNFYCFTLFFLREYKKQYENYYKKGIINYLNNLKEVRDYFSLSNNFFFNLREYDDIRKIKDEQIDCIINDRENETNKSLPKIINMILVYPDAILSGFLFFFDCKEIVEKYYNFLLDLFSYTYSYFRDKYYDPILEYLLNKIMFNEYLKDKSDEKNKFMFKILKSEDALFPYKIKKTNESIIMVFVNYLNNYISKPNINKREPNILQSLRILLYNGQRLELSNRNCIFKLIKSYIGNSIIDILKWIFTLEDIDNDIYNLIFYDSIPLSLDLLLSYFEEDSPLEMNRNNFSKFKSLNKFKDGENNMEIENNNEIKESDYKEYDKNKFIKNIVDNCNSITEDKKVKDLLDPIRTNILSDNISCYKIFIDVFAQIWKMLSMQEREILTVYINEFLYKFVSKPKERNNQVINLLLDAFSQCSPMICIKPIILESLIPFQNFWATGVFYLENLLILGIDVPSSLNALINIFTSLKENDLSNGLKYYFSKNNSSKNAFMELKENNYLKAENTFYECFDNLENDILEKININSLDNEDDILLNANSELFNDLSKWESGLVECYQTNEKWNNIIELSKLNNNNDLKLRGLWYSGSQNWNILNEFSKNIIQYNEPEKNHFMNPYFGQINEIYKNFNNIFADFRENRNLDSKYQNFCMNYIKNIYNDFSSFHPKNLENIDYYFYLIFQLIVEGWEGTNILHDILKRLKDGNSINFKDNLLLWRERLPHFCEGFESLKAILEPRNNLFNFIRREIKADEIDLINYVDKVWTDMTYIKFARKLNLIETFYEKLKLFEQENRNKISIYPYEIYCKDIEYLKFIRKNIHNYDLGIKICNEYINEFNSILKNKVTNEIASYAINNLKEQNAYFYYKKGDIIHAQHLFKESSIFKGKESTNYKLYYDWAEMCEEIAILTKEEEFGSEWYENAIYNFLYTIIYRLDKAKFIIPRMITFIKEFKNESLKDRFNEEIEEIPSWVWIFWLPILFENFNYYKNDNNKNDFYFKILKKVAIKYKQIIYYPYKIYQKILNDETNTAKNPLFEKYNELGNIIYSENKYDHCIDKIEIIIEELEKKETDSHQNALNSILDYSENITFRQNKFEDIKNFIGKLPNFLNYPDLIQFKNNFEQIKKNKKITRNELRECIIQNKYYSHNIIVTENKFKKISQLCEEKLFNIDLNNIELPGYFSNKIEEPTEQNKLYISKLESDYSHKFNTDARAKILIRCSNGKLLNFIIINQKADKNIKMRIFLMQILFNFIYEKNYQTYKRKVCFITPIKYHINSKIKLVEEDTNIIYNMAQIYEYCLQKRGYSPKIANQIFEEEAEKLNINTDLAYYSLENNEKLFYKMCSIIPQDSLKNFIHKFIASSEDILLFRKQFAISYSLNNLFSFIMSHNIILKNISFNKETGFCTFNSDLTLFKDNDLKEVIEQKDDTPLRLTKNISFFLSISSIYGITPEIIYFSCNALINKEKILKSILKICFDSNYNNEKIDMLVKNYINKFKFIININDDNIQNMKNNIMIKDNNENKIDINQKSMKIIYDMIENSMNNDKLKKKSIDYEGWF